MGLLAKLLASSAAAAAAGLYLAPDLAQAQLASTRASASGSDAAPAPSRPADPETLRTRLSLYDNPPQPTVLVPTKSPLQDEVALARQHAHLALTRATDATADLRERLLTLEHHGQQALQSVVSHEDQLNPNAFYVAVATLAGSILGRNRILLRLSLPPLFLLGSTAYFLPHSWDQIVPRLGLSDAWKHDQAQRRIGQVVDQVQKSTSTTTRSQ